MRAPCAGDCDLCRGQHRGGREKLEESGLGRDLDLHALQVVRNKDQRLAPARSLALRANDIILVEGVREEILKIKDASGIEIKADVKLSDPNLQTADTALVEVILLPRSRLIGRTLKKAQFRERYGLHVLALNRHGKNLLRKISLVVLRMGDVLLISSLWWRPPGLTSQLSRSGWLQPSRPSQPSDRHPASAGNGDRDDRAGDERQDHQFLVLHQDPI